MPDYVVIRIAVAVPLFFISMGVWGWATFRSKPKVGVAGFAALYAAIGMLGIIEQ